MRPRLSRIAGWIFGAFAVIASVFLLLSWSGWTEPAQPWLPVSVAVAIGVLAGVALDRGARRLPGRAGTRRSTGAKPDSTGAILSSYDADDLARAFDRLMTDVRESQEHHTRLIIDAAFDAVVTADEHLTIIGWNRQAEVIFGWTREEVIGRRLGETLLTAEQCDAYERSVRELVETGESPIVNRRLEIRLRRRDGASTPVEMAITPIREESGWTLSAFIRDISIRNRTEEALRVSDARFRRLVSLANVVPWEADAATLRLGYIDTRIAKLLGHPIEEWRNASWSDHIHAEDRDAAVARIRDAVARAAEVELEYRMVAAEGWTAWIRDIVSIEQAPDGARLLRGFRFDITERKRLEEQLYGAQKMEAVGRLAGGVAHDFNNLITAILGYTAFIESELLPDDPLRDDIAEIGRAANRAANLTQQLLAFARRRVIQPRVVVLNELIHGVEKMLRRLSGETIQLVTLTEARLWPVKVDPGQFEQVLVNLVVNARDAMPNGGRIIIETANTTLHDSPGQRPAIVTGPYVMIAVTDTGVGMDEKTKARIFEPFFTTKPVGEGTGLGLATCYGIVKQAAGYIWAFSEVGKGTTIRIYLPRAEEVPEVAAGSATELPGTAGHETVLLVEDQPQVRELAQRALTARGYSVLTAEDGQRAVQVAAAHDGPIHLLLTDMVMPFMGGREAADRILADRPDTRVLFMSGYSEHDVANPGLLEGSAFIAKPFTPLELEHAVRAAIDGTPRTDPTPVRVTPDIGA